MKAVKEYDTRRIKILDAAEKLFITKGYVDTTISNIIDESGVSKTTFYHHFTSKDDVMDKVISRIVDSGVIQAKIIAANQSYTIYEKIFFIMTAQKPSVENNREKMKDEIHKVDNSRFHEKSLTESILKLSPILGDVVEEGNQNGELNARYPRESIEFLLTVAQFLLDNEAFEWTEEEILTRITAFIYSMEMILGAKEGSFSDIIKLLFQ